MIKKMLTGSLLVVALTVGAAACGTADVKQSKFESELKDKTSLTSAQAKCVAQKLYAKDGGFDQKTINKLYTANDDKDISKDVQDKFEKMVTDCASSK